MNPTRRHDLRLSSTALLLALAFASPARAEDALIEFRVLDWEGRPLDGKVTLSGPKTLSCTTLASRCSIKAPPGKYKATLMPRSGRAPKERELDISSGMRPKIVMAALAPAAEPVNKTAAQQAPGTVNTAAATSIAPVVSSDPKVSEHDQVRKNPPGRNLQKGTKRTMSGRVLDSAGRPADALVVVFPAGKTTVVGHVVSVAGRFDLLDVPPGKYTAKVYARSGGAPTTQNVTVSPQPGQLLIKVK